MASAPSLNEMNDFNILSTSFGFLRNVENRALLERRSLANDKINDVTWKSFHSIFNPVFLISRSEKMPVGGKRQNKS